MRIDGSAALVAGGASGLGEATVRHLHGAGAHVVIADLNRERGAALAGELGERASFAFTDVTQPDTVQAAVAQATAQTGMGCGSASAAPASATASGSPGVAAPTRWSRSRRSSRST